MPSGNLSLTPEAFSDALSHFIVPQSKQISEAERGRTAETEQIHLPSSQSVTHLSAGGKTEHS